MRASPSTVWHWAISDRARPQAQRIIEEYGLFPQMLRALPGACLGALPVNTDRNGFFEVDPAGDWMAAIASEITFEGEAVDIVCFDPAMPCELYRLTGNSAWLGFNELHRRSDPYFADFLGPICADNSITDDALCLTWDALTWIRAAGTMALPLDRTAFYDLCSLRPSVSVICDNKAGAIDIYKFLTRPPAHLPQVRVTMEALGRAA